MKVYKCSSCDFKATGPSSLGKHYKDTGHKKKQYQPKSQPDHPNPEHNSATMSLETLIETRDHLREQLKNVEDAIEQRLETMGLKWQPPEYPVSKVA